MKFDSTATVHLKGSDEKNGRMARYQHNADSDWAIEEPQSFGWRTSLLPFVEEKGVFDSIEFTHGARHRQNAAAVSQVLPIFQCPSTPGHPRSVFLVSGRGATSGAYDYAIPVVEVIASGPVPAFNGLSVRRYETVAEVRREIDMKGGWSFAEMMGPSKLKWVTDGLSKTTAVFEQAWHPFRVHLVHKHQVWEEVADLNGPLEAEGGWAHPAASGWGAREPINRSNILSRFSFHAGGANNATLDGSVRFLSESTELDLLRAMDTRAGGEVELVQHQPDVE